MKFATPYNYVHAADPKETNLVILDPETGELKPMPSCTVPDQTVSIKEIVDRTKKGQIISGALKAVYDSNDVLPDPRSLDYVERQEMLERAEQELNEINDRQNQRKAAKAAKMKEQAEQYAAFLKLVKERDKGEPVPPGTNNP